MQTTKLGSTGLVVSRIGLGMEHFHEAPEHIAPTLHRALDAGINYVDLMIWTAHDKDVFAAALKGHRDEVFLAAHLGAAETKGQYRRSRDVAESEALIDDWLRRLGTDHVDVLPITYLDSPRDYDKVAEPGGILDLALRLKKEGKARFIGLSGHQPVTAMRAIEDGRMDVIMHPIHMANDSDEQRKELQALCAKRGVGLVGMKPFAGGDILARENPPSPLRCMHYALSQPGVSLSLMGVKNVQELEANLAYLTATDEEKNFNSVLGNFRQGLEGACVYCNHCQPCPAEIDIASVLRILPAVRRWGVEPDIRADYDLLTVPASECVECGVCEERCPFGVEIIVQMREAVQAFGA